MKWRLVVWMIDEAMGLTINPPPIPRDGTSGDTTTPRTSLEPHLRFGLRHGFRALHVFLERHYQPVAETPMSHVRGDCADALDSGASGVAVWTRWHDALVQGENADISFRLSKPEGGGRP